jgi:DNA-binding response OmpR family regulator
MATDMLEGRTTHTHTTYSCGDVQLDVDARVVLVAGKRVMLTYGEFELLLKLVADPGRAFTRHQLRVDLPGSAESTPRAVDLRVMRLRKKLAAAESFTIETVPHIGYRCWTSADGQAAPRAGA